MFHDHSDLLCQQIFCLFAVAGIVEFVHQRFALVDPSHQVVHRHMWVAVRKIEHGQFSLTVTFYLKHSFFSFCCNVIGGLTWQGFLSSAEEMPSMKEGFLSFAEEMPSMKEGFLSM